MLPQRNQRRNPSGMSFLMYSVSHDGGWRVLSYQSKKQIINRVKYLFSLYEALSAPLLKVEKKKRTKKKED